MQQSIARQAEHEAKRRTQNLVRSKISQTINNTRKSKDFVRKKTNKMGNSTKSGNISI